ncbi:MAG: hypothetical protein ACBR13_19580 [Microcoleus sp.]
MSNHKNDFEDKVELVVSGVGGAVAGASLSGAIGGMGLTVAGTGIAITTAPVAAAGAVVGLALYGIKKAFFN